MFNKILAWFLLASFIFSGCVPFKRPTVSKPPSGDSRGTQVATQIVRTMEPATTSISQPPSAFASTPTDTPEPPEIILGKQHIRVESVCLETTVSFLSEESSGQIEYTINSLFDHMGVRAVEKGQPCDATLTILLIGNAFSDFYSLDGRLRSGTVTCFTGGKTSAQFQLMLPDQQPVDFRIEQFFGSISPEVINGCVTDVADLPFSKEWWISPLIDGLRRIWGLSIYEASIQTGSSGLQYATLTLLDRDLTLGNNYQIFQAAIQPECQIWWDKNSLMPARCFHSFWDYLDQIGFPAVLWYQAFSQDALGLSPTYQFISSKEPVVPLLMSALKQESETIREKAARMLGELGPAATEAALPIREYFLAMEKSNNPYSALMYAVALAKIGEASDLISPVILEQLQPEESYFNSSFDTALAESVFDAAGEIGGDAIVQALIDIIQIKTSGNYDYMSDSEIRNMIGAINTLGKIGDERATSVLIRLIQNTKSNKPLVRELHFAAIKALGTTSSEDATVDYWEEILKDPGYSDKTRQAAARALGKIGSKRVVDDLLGIIQDERSDRLAIEASAIALSESDAQQRIGETLKKVLQKTSNARIGYILAQSYPQPGLVMTLNSILQQLLKNKDYSSEEKELIFDALGVLAKTDPSARQALEKHLNLPSNAKYSAAVELLINDPSNKKALTMLRQAIQKAIQEKDKNSMHAVMSAVVLAGKSAKELVPDLVTILDDQSLNGSFAEHSACLALKNIGLAANDTAPYSANCLK